MGVNADHRIAVSSDRPARSDRTPDDIVDGIRTARS
jgi:hypothetical protein